MDDPAHPEAMDAFQWLDATAQARLVRTREVAPAELVDAALTRLDAMNPGLNAVVTAIDPPSVATNGPFAGGIRRLGREPLDWEIEPQTRAYWESARQVGAAEYLLAVQTMQRIGRRVADWFQTYDAWLTPTLGAGPPMLGDLVGTETDPLRGSRNAGRYLMFDGELANVIGNPAMSVPFGADADGLPVGIHLLGRFGDEATLFRLAGQLEQAVPWAHRRPS